MINVGTIIASAIFIVPSTIALQLHASAPTILVWVVGGAVSLLGALCVAERGAAMPRAGGLYVYLSEAYGPGWGYVYGWTGGSVANFRPLWPEGSFGSLIAPFGVAMVAALWAYDGWIEITYVGGEVKDPERNLPRSIVLSTLIGIALYCLVTASFTYVLSPAK